MNAARLTKKALRIPMRVERGPTDILKALAATVKYIPTEPGPMLMDDPYLLPTSYHEKRNYTLARLSGMKTAKFFLNKYPELFHRDDAEPKVEAFLPLEEFNTDMELTEDDIIWCIDNNDPVNGVIAYKTLEEKGIKLSDENLLKFFEMICYTNEERQLDYIDYERVRAMPDSEENLVKFTWKNSGLASKIFNTIKEDLDSPRVYSAMIAGLCKFNEYAAAKQVFDDFRNGNMDQALYIEAYEGLLRGVSKLNSSVITAHKSVDEIVQHMESHKVMPTLEVFHAILRTYRVFQVDENTCHKAFKLMNDMKTLNIEPSLGTFGPLIGIICRYKNGRVFGSMIYEILSYVDLYDSSTVKDDTNSAFLSSTMSSITNHLNNLKLANKLHKIYLKRPNLFTTPKIKSRYLNNYFKLIVTTDTLKNMLEFYDTNVPFNFQPTPDCYEAFIEALDLYQAPEDVIKRIGQHIIDFKLYDRITSDEIFRKHPEYMTALEKSMESKFNKY